MFKIVAAHIIKGTHIKARFQIEVAGVIQISNIKLCQRDEEYFILFPRETYTKKSGVTKVEKIINMPYDSRKILLDSMVQYYEFFTGVREKPVNQTKIL